MRSADVITFPNCRQSRGSEAQSGDFLPVELAGDHGRDSASESVSPAPFSTEGLDLLLLQATRTAARSRRLAKRARQFLSECQSVSCGGVTISSTTTEAAMTNNTPAAYFDRAKAISKIILEAQEDLKQLKADATEELIDESMSKNEAKEIREDLAEVFYLARLEAKSELPKSAKKIARRIRMAAECGVQLSFMDDLQNVVTLASATSPRVREVA